MSVIGCILLLVITLFSGCIQETTSTTSGDINFPFVTLDGQTKQLSDYYGKVIVLDLMGARCPPCQQEMFELKKISENYSHDQVTIISINVWVSLGENAALVQELIDAFDEQVGIELDWIFGLDDASATIGNAYTQGGVPTVHIIDQNGNLYYSHYEYTDYSTMASKIDELLT
jgi:thiol-disulfide isomerase/thioredoxin